MQIGHSWYYGLQLDKKISRDDHFDDLADFQLLCGHNSSIESTKASVPEEL